MSSDNRRFLRVPVSQSNRTATVRFDGKSFSGEVVNESSGGFGLVIPPLYAVAFPPGRIVVMEVNDLVIKVRVAHAKSEDDRFILGLERIEELEDKAATKQQQWSWLATLRSSVGHSVVGPSTLLRDVSIALALAGGLVLFLYWPNLTELLEGKKKPRKSGSSAAIAWPWWSGTSSKPAASPAPSEAGPAAPAVKTSVPPPPKSSATEPPQTPAPATQIDPK